MGSTRKRWSNTARGSSRYKKCRKLRRSLEKFHVPSHVDRLFHKQNGLQRHGLAKGSALKPLPLADPGRRALNAVPTELRPLLC